MPTTTAEIADLFDDFAALLEKKGEAVFKIRADQLASQAIEQLPYPLETPVSRAAGAWEQLV